MKFRFSSDFVVDSDVEPWRRVLCLMVKEVSA